MDRDDRNPLFIPGKAGPEGERQQGCPKCGKNEWVGRNLGGQYKFTCKACNNTWTGGIPQVPADPRIPMTPSDPRDIPTMQFVRNNKGDFDELRRRPNPTPDFRTGAPIPSTPEDEEI